MRKTGNADTVLGFDFGTKRIGIAVGSTVTGSARPLLTLPARDGVPDWIRLTQVVVEWNPARLVVGLPLNMDGSDSEITVRARSFARKLSGRLVLPVDTIDERLTSFEARGEILRAGNSKQKQDVDALAAALIVQSWLAQPRTQG